MKIEVPIPNSQLPKRLHVPAALEDSHDCIESGDSPREADKCNRFGGWDLAVGGCALLAILSAGCGKKGPPLAPLVPIPAAVGLIEANRLGSEVYVTLTIPSGNIDEHTPADIGRIEVYGYTGRTAPPRAHWVELATLVASLAVAPPPKPGEQPESPSTVKKPPSDPPQGARITVRDTLTEDELVQGKQVAVRDPRSAPRDPQPTVPDPQASPIPGAEPRTADRGPRVAELPLMRFYTAVPFNTRGRPGPPGAVAEFPVLSAPDAPPSLNARYTERAIMLAWEPSGGLLGFLLERALPEEPIPFAEEEASVADAVSEPSGPAMYNVYREILPDAMAPPGPRAANWNQQPAVPLTPVPVSALDFVDSVEFERRRCYTVRAVRGAGPAARVGDASPLVCLTPVDVFAPAPPKSLAAVASEGAISLIWEPNGELDLGGYVVLRGDAPGDTLQPLTAAPVVEAGYRDETVKPGVRYVYAVMAVDNRVPLPNVSASSERVEETAR